jgi:hypothetical protein
MPEVWFHEADLFDQEQLRRYLQGYLWDQANATMGLHNIVVAVIKVLDQFPASDRAEPVQLLRRLSWQMEQEDNEEADQDRNGDRRFGDRHAQAVAAGEGAPAQPIRLPVGPRQIRVLGLKEIDEENDDQEA